MEHLFLSLLVLIMIAALASGFPVAFALPGSAIIAIGLAAFFGYLFEGNVSAYFATDGPIEWLIAGIRPVCSRTLSRTSLLPTQTNLEPLFIIG